MCGYAIKNIRIYVRGNVRATERYVDKKNIQFCIYEIALFNSDRGFISISAPSSRRRRRRRWERVRATPRTAHAEKPGWSAAEPRRRWGTPPQKKTPSWNICEIRKQDPSISPKCHENQLEKTRGRKLGKLFFHVRKRENKFSHVGKTRKTRKNENLPYGPDETLKTLIIRF